MRGKSASDLTEQEVRNIAVRYLGRREYGVEELRSRLRQRGADATIADSVIVELVDNGLVSDQRFTEMYVRMRMRLMFGPLKIRGELRSRGISDTVIAGFLPAEPETWIDKATQWAAKRHRGGELDFAERARIHRSLASRGFTHEQANAAVSGLQRSLREDGHEFD